MNWFLTEFVSPPLQGRLFRGQLSKNTFMTKLVPGLHLRQVVKLVVKSVVKSVVKPEQSQY